MGYGLEEGLWGIGYGDIFDEAWVDRVEFAEDLCGVD